MKKWALHSTNIHDIQMYHGDTWWMTSTHSLGLVDIFSDTSGVDVLLCACASLHPKL